MSIVRKTQSVCPQCLRVLDAYYISQNIQQVPWIFLQKNCPEHGQFSSPVWVDLPHTPSFAQWYTQEPPQHPPRPMTEARQGCPFDCGLCPNHAQSTCCSLLEITQRCNLQCPVCYANTNNATKDPSLAQLETSLEALLHHAGAVNVQISGGEPTIREDLEQIIALVQRKGFSFIQLNTNGLRLGTEEGYAHKLKAAGLTLVYLQWDDIDDSTYIPLRGQPCARIKEQALHHCLNAGLAVVLVATIVKGINDTALGNIVHNALRYGPLVRGVHIQPVSTFGRYPWAENEAPRITIPEILYNLEQQTQGMIKATDFHPPRSEHALCSFNAVYERTIDRRLELTQAATACCSPTKAARRAQEFVAQHWSAPELVPLSLESDFDKALKKMHHRFTVSGMAFQDAYNLDLERLRRCHIHILSAEHTIIPFCAYNLTSNQGFALYRKAMSISQ